MRLFLFGLLAILLACNRPSQSTSGSTDSVAIPMGGQEEDLHQITCWGIGEIELGDDLTALEEKLGKENLSQDSLFLEGTFEGFVTKVWKDSEKEVIIHWKEKKLPFKTVDYLEVTQRNSPYLFANGIKIGSSLGDIVALNGGKPIRFYGFGWDYGGTFTSFNKGNLEGDIPCFGGVFTIEAENDSPALGELMGDHEISSDHPSLKEYAVKLQKIKVINKG